MGLKYRIAKLEDVAENLRDMYKVEGTGFVLDVDGAVAKERLDEFRSNNITLQQQLEKLKDVDPVKYRELIELDRKVKEKELIEAGKVDEVVNMRVQQLREEHEGLVGDLNKKLGSANSMLEVLLLDNVVRDKSIKNGVLPTAVDDVVLRAKSVFKVENNQPTAKDADGKVIYGKDGTTPLTPEEWILSLRKSAPHLFQMSSGGGAGGGTGHGAVDMSKLSPAQKIAMGLSQQAGQGR